VSVCVCVCMCMCVYFRCLEGRRREGECRQARRTGGGHFDTLCSYASCSMTAVHGPVALVTVARARLTDPVQETVNASEIIHPCA
jgi:hypothetical protein